MDRAIEEPILVAVRARPLTFSEREGKAALCVELSTKRATLTDPWVGGVKDFQYEQCFASEGGRADNQVVYRDFACKLVDNALAGYNTTFISYGQTGSGKSYGLLGPPPGSLAITRERGLVSQVASDLLARAGQQFAGQPGLSVDLTVLSLYNEEVTDVLTAEPKPRGGVKVVSHPRLGAILPTASRHIVESAADIDRLLGDALTLRALTAVRTNANTARMTNMYLVTLQVTVDGTPRVSTITLVDMPGSEYSGRSDSVAPPPAATAQAASAAGGSAPAAGAAASAVGGAAAAGASKDGSGAAHLAKAPLHIPAFARSVNKSIVTFCDCLEALAKGSAASSAPFGSSKLSQLLRSALAGNSRTLFLANISPVAADYAETLTTLRMADRVKRLRTKPVLTADPYARAIAEAKEEQGKLEASLSTTVGGRTFSALSEAERNAVSRTQLEVDAIAELLRFMTVSSDAIRTASAAAAAGRAQILQQAGVESAAALGSVSKSAGSPHLLALHADPVFAGVLRYELKEGTPIICRPTAGPGVGDIVVDGLQLLQVHAKLVVSKGVPTKLQVTKGARVFVNGQPVTASIDLIGGARLLMGAYLVFVFEAAGGVDAANIRMPGGEPVSWAAVMQETNAASVQAMIGLDDVTAKQAEEEEKAAADTKTNSLRSELEQCREGLKAAEQNYSSTLMSLTQKTSEHLIQSGKRLKGLSGEALAAARAAVDSEQQALQQERTALADKFEKQKQDFARRDATLEAQLKQASAWDDPTAVAARGEAAQRKRAEKEAALMRVLPMVNEANALCTELRQNHLVTSVKLVLNKADAGSAVGPSGVGVRVHNGETGTEVVYSAEQFAERLIIWGVVYETYCAFGEFDLPSRDEDNPFSVLPIGPQLLGTCHVLLQPMYYLLPVSERTPIIDYKGDVIGKLDLRVIPLPRTYKKGDNEDDLFFEEDDITEFLNDRFHFLIRFKRASGLPKKFTKDVFVRYRLFCDDEDQTSDPAEISSAPKIDYRRTVRIDLLTNDLIKTIHSGVLEVQVFGSMVDDITKSDPNWAKLISIVDGPQTAADAPAASSSSSSAAAAAVSSAPAQPTKFVEPEELLKRVQEAFGRQVALEKERDSLQSRLYELEQSAAKAASTVASVHDQQRAQIETLRAREAKARERQSELEQEMLEGLRKERERREREEGALAAQAGSVISDEVKAVNEARAQAEEAQGLELVSLRVRLATTESALEDEKREQARLQDELLQARSAVREMETRRAADQAELAALRSGEDAAAASAAASAAADAAIASQAASSSKESEELRVKLDSALRDLNAKEEELKAVELKRQYEQERERALEEKDKEHEDEVRRLRQTVMQLRKSSNQKSSTCAIM